MNFKASATAVATGAFGETEAYGCPDGNTLCVNPNSAITFVDTEKKHDDVSWQAAKLSIDASDFKYTSIQASLDTDKAANLDSTRVRELFPDNDATIQHGVRPVQGDSEDERIMFRKDRVSLFWGKTFDSFEEAQEKARARLEEVIRML